MLYSDPRGRETDEVEMRALRLMILVCALSTVTAACDRGAAKVAKPWEPQFDELYVLSAVPYRTVDEASGFEPVCRPEDGTPDGLMLRHLQAGHAAPCGRGAQGGGAGGSRALPRR